jgi:succinate-acetate transporter protein
MEKCLIPRRLALTFAGLLLCILFLHSTGIFSVDKVGNALPLFCPFKAITGIPCPGCGMTRAILSMTKGDFHGAFAFNPFSFFLLFMVIISTIPAGQITKLPSVAPILMNYFLITVLITVVLYWVFQRLLPALQ